MIEIKLDKDGIEWEEITVGLLRNQTNEKLIDCCQSHISRLFSNERYCPRILDFLENSKYKVDLDENKGSNLQFIKVRNQYYEMCEHSSLHNIKFQKSLKLAIYTEIDLSYGRKLAVESLTSIVQEDLSLGDKRIIRDIALENFYSNLEKAVDGNCSELWNAVSSVSTDLHDWPKNQLISYGFKIKHPNFYDISLTNL